MIERAAIILIGGRGRRLGNVEKALMSIRDTTLIEHVIKVLDPLVDEIIVPARDEAQARVLEPLVGGRVCGRWQVYYQVWRLQVGNIRL